jgi:hypothetical protein
VKGDEPRGARRSTDAVTARIRVAGKKQSRGIRSRGADVKACHPSTEKSFRCACFRFHQWGSALDAQIGPSTLLCPCGRMHRRGKEGPVRGSEWYDHNGRRKPCPGQEA